MQFSGEERFVLDPSKVWSRVLDVDFIVQTMPGLQRVEQTGPRLLVCRVRPGLSFFSGALTLTLEIVDARPPHSARMHVCGKGIGASVVVETSIRLSAVAGGTLLAWNSAVTQRDGLLRAVSPGLLEGAAQKIVADVWNNVHRELEG